MPLSAHAPQFTSYEGFKKYLKETNFTDVTSELLRGPLENIIKLLREHYQNLDDTGKKNASLELLKIIGEESSLLGAPISLDIRNTCAFADEAYAKNVGGDFPDEVKIFWKACADRYKPSNFPKWGKWGYEIPTSLPHPTVRLLCYLGFFSKEVCGEDLLIDPAVEKFEKGEFSSAFSKITGLPVV